MLPVLKISLFVTFFHHLKFTTLLGAAFATGWEDPATANPLGVISRHYAFAIVLLIPVLWDFEGESPTTAARTDPEKDLSRLAEHIRGVVPQGLSKLDKLGELILRLTGCEDAATANFLGSCLCGTL